VLNIDEEDVLFPAIVVGRDNTHAGCLTVRFKVGGLPPAAVIWVARGAGWVFCTLRLASLETHLFCFE